MTRVTAEISMSLDGFVAGANRTFEEPLGTGGADLHEWAFRLAAWREPHGLPGGETGPESQLVESRLASTGAFVMGRAMFSGGSGPWAEDANDGGWWGDDPPFHNPVFVVTHHPRETLVLEGGTSFTFVTDGIESAVGEARAAAGGKDVLVAGGAAVVQQCLAAGLLDGVLLHLVPLFLGGGVRLFEGVPPGRLEVEDVIGVPRATHVSYRVVR